MRILGLAFVAVLTFAVQFQLGLTVESTVPAFLWSRHQERYSSGESVAVDYRTLSPKDLAKSVMSEGGWSNILCSGKEAKGPMDFALLFVGSELHSLDISTPKNADAALVDLLKVSILNSNFSRFFPYIAASEDREPLESTLLSEFTDSCGKVSGISKIAVTGTCSVEGANIEKLTGIKSVNDYIVTRMAKGSSKQTELIIFCHGGSNSPKEADKEESESQIFSELISSVEQLGAKYTILYASDPLRSTEYPSQRVIERFLAESSKSGPLNSTCDGVCQIKSTLLEGLFVGIVLLLILISGLCCMAGIDTPTRFETPPES